MGQRCFILAQGKQSRLHLLSYPKQFHHVDGEPILYRMVRLAKRQQPTLELTLIAPYGALWSRAAQDMGIGHITLQEPGNTILKGVAQLLQPSVDRVHFLLGDVIYSEEVMQIILNSTQPLFFTGRLQKNPVTGRSNKEMYSMSFAAEYLEQVDEEVKASIKDKGYRLFSLFEKLYSDDREPTFYEVEDYTDDLDLVDDIPYVQKISDFLKRQRHGN